ncbi:hypothetical protein EYS14_03530 [Alteromonadaceae bacterium M269]|nr:hypothetical protein EYS14_03530 [Alteromonadaceae bacterium M269]
MHTSNVEIPKTFEELQALNEVTLSSVEKEFKVAVSHLIDLDTKRMKAFQSVKHGNHSLGATLANTLAETLHELLFDSNEKSHSNSHLYDSAETFRSLVANLSRWNS